MHLQAAAEDSDGVNVTHCGRLHLGKKPMQATLYQ